MFINPIGYFLTWYVYMHPLTLDVYAWIWKQRFVLDPCTDTLLNVFLAIAVDNLTNAQEMTAAEEEEEVGRKEVPVSARNQSFFYFFKT